MGACTSAAPDPEGTNHTPASSNTESKLSKSGYLQEIPIWFPPENAHQNISQLFQLSKEIGRGATGYVFAGFYQSKECAIKRIEQTDEFGAHFAAEARVLSSVSHSAIIRCVDMLMDDVYYYLILDKADYDLYQLMREKQYLSEKETKNVIYSILCALHYMHSLNIAHRDLKPENIVFKVCCGEFKAQLIDFGDAVVAVENKVYTEFAGTPCYMSPERLCQHNGEQLKKSDVWALGCVAFEMYSGCRCFDGTQKAIFGRVLRGEWSWNVDRKPSVLMNDFVSQCLNVNSEQRLSANDALKHQWFADMTKT